MTAKILIVEDDGPTQELLGTLLRARGHSVWTVSDGGAALAAAIAHLPDLIVCDINLPTVDGHVVLQQLKETPATAKIPVVAITASAATSSQAMQNVRDRILALGFV